MVSINYATREVSCKVVYYGPGLSGKTTNLQYVHEKVPSETKGKLISLATDTDRTLYFDFLPINIGSINGFAAKFQLYTVPGQVYYNATRKLVLRGVDGLVFVADSQPDKMDENIESLNNLKENLVEYGYNISELPIVIQYNKQDLPGVLSVQEMHAALNNMNCPEFGASATEGFGVFDTLKCILKLVLDKSKTGGTAQTSKPASSSSPEAAPVKAANQPLASGEVGAVAPQTPVPPAAVTPVAASEFREKYQDAAQPNLPSVPEPSNVASDPPPPVYREEVSPSPGESANRPFPGNSSDDYWKAGANTLHGSEARATLERERINYEKPKVTENPVEDKPVIKENNETPSGYPRMEPSLKADGSPKKRSFLKRLFGLK